jgi:hypothetical protein
MPTLCPSFCKHHYSIEGSFVGLYDGDIPIVLVGLGMVALSLKFRKLPASVIVARNARRISWRCWPCACLVQWYRCHCRPVVAMRKRSYQMDFGAALAAKYIRGPFHYLPWQAVARGIGAREVEP